MRRTHLCMLGNHSNFVHLATPPRGKVVLRWYVWFHFPHFSRGPTAYIAMHLYMCWKSGKRDQGDWSSTGLAIDQSPRPALQARPRLGRRSGHSIASPVLDQSLWSLFSLFQHIHRCVATRVCMQWCPWKNGENRTRRAVAELPFPGEAVL